MSVQLENIAKSLLQAVRNGNLQHVTKIVNNFGLCFSPNFLEGYFLLCNAIQCRHFKVAQVLIEKGAKLKGKSDSALHLAAEEKSLEIVEALLNHGAEINCVRIRDLCTPLHIACMKGCNEIVSLLLNGGADVNMKAYNNSTPLLLAVHNRNYDIIESLLKQGALVRCTRLSDSYTPLHIACEKGSLNLVYLLLKWGADSNAKAHENVTPLQLTARQGFYLETVELLKYGAQINCSRLSNKRTPLHEACEGNSENCVKYLLEHGADPNARANNNVTPLHLATENVVRKSIVESLLNHGAQVKCLRLSDNYTPLHLVCTVRDKLWSRGNPAEIVDLLLSHNADPNAIAKDNTTPLQLAASNEWLEVVQSLLKHGAKVNVSRLGDTYSPLHIACKSKRVEIVETLLRSGADPNAKDYFNDITPLHLAVYEQSPEIVKSLLEYGAQVNSWTSHFPEKPGPLEKMTPLHLACGRGHLGHGMPDIAILLLESGADPNVKADNDLTPLHLAVGSCFETVEALIKHGAQVNCPRLPDNFTPLHIAFANNFMSVNVILDIAKVLLNKGADPNFKSIDGITPFLLAVKEKHVALIDLFLENAADISAKTREGASPFGEALKTRDRPLIKILKKHAVKLKVACLPVCEKILLLLQQANSLKLRNFQQNCEEEVQKMKSTKFLGYFALYDLLRYQRNPVFAKNKALMASLLSFNFYKETPLYRNFLLNCLKRCIPRLELVTSGRKWLGILIRTSGILNGKRVALPEELLLEIVSYLNDRDLNNLIVCGEDIRFQLSN